MNSFKEYGKEHIPAIDTLIENFYIQKEADVSHDFMAAMYKDLREYLKRPGKRIRPLLLMIAYEGYAKGKKNSAEMQKLAAALELMHSMLLLQDDIIDNATTRRGAKALHIITEEKYGPLSSVPTTGHDIAIVLGDILFANALELVSEADICNRARKRFLSIFSRTYEMTAWGQILDSLHTMPKKVKVAEKVPLTISTLKTAYYTIYYPILMGYVLTGPGGDEEKSAIEDFALPLGLAFQIRDDILGSFGDENEIGKAGDGDIVEGKMTLLVQHTLELLKKKEREEFLELLQKKKKTKKDLKNLRHTMIATGALKKTDIVHRELIETARMVLSALTINKKTKVLLEDLIGLIEDIPSETFREITEGTLK